MASGSSLVVASNVTSATARGILTAFEGTYRPRKMAVDNRLSKVMRLGLPSDKLQEVYGYYNSAPHPVRWIKGQDIPRKGFQAVNFSVTNYDWGRAVDWHENDEQDDQLGGLVEQARTLGVNFAQLPERVFYQIITGGTDLDLLPAVPNAPDGAALYATTAGGANRFGVSGGNILTGSGVTTSAAIRDDFFDSIELFAQFQDVEGEPFFNESELAGEYVILYNVQNEGIFRQAFSAQTHHSVVSSTGAAISNVILDSGIRLQLWSTPRITDNDWFIFQAGSELKPVFQQIRSPLRSNVEDMENSDKARRSKIKSLQFDARMGFGVGPAYSTVKVNN